MRQTCDGFDYAVRNLRDLLIYRNTQHLNGDPVQGSVINHSVLQSQSSMQYAVFLPAAVFPCYYQKIHLFKTKKKRLLSVVTTFVCEPDPLLNCQVFLLIISCFWTEGFLVETSHYVLFDFIHNTLYFIRRTYKKKPRE